MNGVYAGFGNVGDSVHVFADDAPTSSQVFDHWTGDVGVVADPNAAHTTFVWNNQSVALTAVFKAAPGWSPVQSVSNGAAFWYYVPAGAHALIFLFHGTGASAADWFQRPEQLSFVRQAVAAGYGVAALSSADRSTKKWAVTPISTANVDIQNVMAGLSSLQSAGLISASTPIFAVGTSDGGRMSVRVAWVLGWKGVSNYVSQGDPDPQMITTTTPTRFNMRLRDTQPIVSWQDALRYTNSMQSRGVPTGFVLDGPMPLYSKVFTRIPGVSVANSSAIYNALVAASLLDARGFFKVDPTTNPGAWKGVVSNVVGAQVLGPIQDILDNSYSEHGFFSDMNDVTLSFFDQLH